MAHVAPPIVRQAQILRRDIELAVTGWARQHRNNTGVAVRQAATAVNRLATRAWNDRERRRELVLRLDEAVDYLKLELQLGKDINAMASFAQFEDLFRKAEALGAQVGGWRKQLHPEGQNPAPRATSERATTLSARTASNREANR